MKILKSLMFISLATIFSQLNLISTNSGTLDISNNNVGLTAEDECHVFPENSLTGDKTIINIECNSGQKFENVCSQEQPTTEETHPWMLGNGYIGKIDDFPASGKRTIYWAYKCHLQASEK